MTESGSDPRAILNAGEPTVALVIGGVLGAATYFLCALLLGARLAIVVAAVAVLVALVRRMPTAAIAFGVAAVLAGVGLRPSTAALACAAAVFGLALALFSKGWMLRRIEAAEASVARPSAAAELRKS